MGADEPLLTPQEAGDRYRVSAKTILRLIAAGTVPAVKIGRQWRIRRVDLDAALASPPASPTPKKKARR